MHAGLPALEADWDDDALHTAVDEFRGAGLLHIKGAIDDRELEWLRAETARLIEDDARDDRVLDPDGRPYRIEYVVDKSRACAALAAHPAILAAAAAIAGDDFVPTWDSMVFKRAGAGMPIAWHRDFRAAEAAWEPRRHAVVCNVGTYLDDTDAQTCLWAIPGSTAWDDARAEQAIAARDVEEFAAFGAVPVPVPAGDLLVHDALLVHGSAPSQSGLRRVVYYEFRPASVERAHGPHVPEYADRKLEVLDACVTLRAAPDARSPLPTLRFPHERWWRGYC
jgi:ectoine hydroxylase-related dioxygenase (phytanoyl-CoA dioxygenase family)